MSRMDESETIYDAAADDEADNEAADDLTDEQPPMAEPMAEPMALSVYRGPSNEEIAALKDMLKAANRDMSDAQFTVFLAAAKHLGLDPLARQIVPIFQGGRMTVQTTIDGFRLIAERTRKYRGQLGPFWCGKDGVWHDAWIADDAPLAAKVGVKRSDFDEPMWGVARTKSYSKGGNWNSMPDVMIAKVAESLALRKAFPAELSGAYTDDELLIVDADPPTPPTPATSASPAAPKRPSAPAPSRQASQASQTKSATKTANDFTTTDGCNPLGDAPLRKRMSALNIRSIEDVETFLTRVKRQHIVYARAAIEDELTQMETRTQATNGHDLRETFPASAAHSA